MRLRAIQNCATEWYYSSGKAYVDPFNEVTLDVEITGPDGQRQVVPAFWAGEQTWRMRIAGSSGEHKGKVLLKRG